jgi:hypothetical protein
MTSSQETAIDEYVVELYSDYGKLVFSKSSRDKKLQIDTGSFPKGNYILKIITKGNVITHHVYLM